MIEDKDLFGEPVLPARPKRLAAKQKMSAVDGNKIAEPTKVRFREAKPSGRKFPRWLKRYLYNSAHETAAKATAIVLVPIVLSILVGAMVYAQQKFDWIGRTKSQIGDWTTTVKPAR